MNLVLEIIARKRCRVFRFGFSPDSSGILLQSAAAKKIKRIAGIASKNQTNDFRNPLR